MLHVMSYVNEVGINYSDRVYTTAVTTPEDVIVAIAIAALAIFVLSIIAIAVSQGPSTGHHTHSYVDYSGTGGYNGYGGGSTILLVDSVGGPNYTSQPNYYTSSGSNYGTGAFTTSAVGGGGHTASPGFMTLPVSRN